MEEFYPFFVVLFAAVFFSTVFRRLHFPWVIALILGGIIIGPHGVDILEINETISFLGQIGLVFLMFMAGLEIQFSTFRSHKRDISVIALFNGVLPFFAGVGIGFLFGLDILASLLLGIILVSSYIAVIIPSLETHHLFRSRLGRSIVASTIIEDVASLILLSILLQTLRPITQLPLPFFYLLLLAALVSLRWILPRLQHLLAMGRRSKGDRFQQELRSVLVVLVGTVIIFELLGLHPIIAGFFAGLVLAGSVRTDALMEKLRTISYGIFIPVFFIIIGAETDLTVFGEADNVLFLIGFIVIGSMLVKFTSGWIAGRIVGFTSQESSFLGVSTMPQLSTTLAVVFTGVELGILGQELVTAMIILSIMTVFVAPLLMKVLAKRMDVIKEVS